MNDHARYFGFYNSQEAWADNRAFFEYCLQNPGEAGLIGVSEEVAREQLDFLRRFPPGRHDRAVFHHVDIYSVENPSWDKKGSIPSRATGMFGYERRSLVVPRGKLVAAYSADLGTAIKELCSREAAAGEVVEQHATHDVGDGTEIVGMRVRKSPNQGAQSERIFPNGYLQVVYDASFFHAKGSLSYEFGIRTEAITREKPLEFRITECVEIDGQKVREETEVVSTVFETAADGKTPTKFHRLDYSKLSPVARA